MPLPYVLLAAVLFFAAAVLLRCALMRRSQKRSVRFAVLAGGILAVSAALIGVKAAAVSRETYGPRPFTDTNGTVLTEYIDKAGTHSYYTADGCLYRTVSSEGEVWEYDRDGILTYHKDAKSGEKWYENGTLSRERNKKGAEKRYNRELVTYTKSANGFEEWFEYDENG
ncbi:MAG: hypothetical protein ACI4RV_02230, partial [Eubacteriales bacterium]